MFYFLENVPYKVSLHPSNLKSIHHSKNAQVHWKQLARQKATLELEYSFDRKLGFIVELLWIKSEHIQPGVLLPQSGLIEHKLLYSAIALMPMNGEVIDAEVFKVNKESVIFCYMGLIYGIVETKLFPINDDYDSKELVEESGPIRAFVSFKNPNKVIKVGSVIRLRIVQRVFGNSGFWLKGSMQNKFLGLVDDNRLTLIFRRMMRRKKLKGKLRESELEKFELSNRDRHLLHLE